MQKKDADRGKEKSSRTGEGETRKDANAFGTQKKRENGRTGLPFPRLTFLLTEFEEEKKHYSKALLSGALAGSDPRSHSGGMEQEDGINALGKKKKKDVTQTAGGGSDLNVTLYVEGGGRKMNRGGKRGIFRSPRDSHPLRRDGKEKEDRLMGKNGTLSSITITTSPQSDRESGDSPI